MTDLTAVEAGENFLEHYGVLGMKWGRTKADGNSAVPSRAEKKQANKDRNLDIKTARLNQVKRGRQYEEAQGDFYVSRTNKGQDKTEKIMRDLERELYTGSDAIKGAQWTSGEKKAYTAVGAVAVAGFLASIGLTLTGY